MHCNARYLHGLFSGSQNHDYYSIKCAALLKEFYFTWCYCYIFNQAILNSWPQNCIFKDASVFVHWQCAILWLQLLSVHVIPSGALNFSLFSQCYHFLDLLSESSCALNTKGDPAQTSKAGAMWDQSLFLSQQLWRKTSGVFICMTQATGGEVWQHSEEWKQCQLLQITISCSWRCCINILK